MNLLRGLESAPWLVALARGIVEAIVLAILVTLVAFFTSSNVPEFLQLWAPLIVIVIRQLEGIADQIDPAKKRAPVNVTPTNDAGDPQTLNTRTSGDEGAPQG